jgi:hypothetical protein
MYLCSRVQRPSWFVLSGKKNSKIFYQKTVLKEDRVVTVVIEYDGASRQKYDSIAAEIARSLHVE